MTKKEILEFCSGCGGAYHLRESYFKTRFNKEYVEMGFIVFPEEFSFRQKLYHYLHNDFELLLGICPTCGRRCRFLSFGRGYETYCSKDCMYTEERSKKCKSTKKDRYGDENYNNTNKCKQTCLERYGVENVSQIDDIRQKKIDHMLSRTEDEKEIHRNKVKKTWENKTRNEIQEHVDKIKHTKKKRYGNKNYNNREKFIITTHSEEYSLKKKFDYDRIFHEYKARSIKTNGGVSRLEIDFYDWLKRHFGNDDVFVQYSSDVYPFHCDFYVKSIDLYIELNAHWTHGGRPFSGDEQDMKKLEYWKSKKSEYYDTAVKVWSVSDVEKLKFAEEKKLNYLVIYSNKLYDCIKTFNKFIKI